MKQQLIFDIETFWLENIINCNAKDLLEVFKKNAVNTFLIHDFVGCKNLSTTLNILNYCGCVKHSKQLTKLYLSISLSLFLFLSHSLALTHTFSFSLSLTKKTQIHTLYLSLAFSTTFSPILAIFQNQTHFLWFIKKSTIFCR